MSAKLTKAQRTEVQAILAIVESSGDLEEQLAELVYDRDLYYWRWQRLEDMKQAEEPKV